MPYAVEHAVLRRDLLKGVLCLGLVGAAPGMARTLPDQRFPKVRGMVDRVIGERSAPGAIVAIGQGNARPAYVSGGTIALEDRHVVDEHTLFRIYSMTKPITGMAAMLLIADGKMMLDQPVADFIPGFANMRVLTNSGESLESRPATATLTIRHLLTHSGGLGGGPSAKGPLTQEYERLGLMQNLRSRSDGQGAAAETVTSLKDFADRLATAPLLTDPGTAWCYSVGLDLLGRVIELASGTPFDRFLEQRLFAPLGMNDTFFEVPGGKKARLVTSYAGRGAKLSAVDAGSSSIFLDKPAFPSGGGGLVSSAHDYDRFLTMIANEGRFSGSEILPRSAVTAGTSNLLPQGVNMRNYVGIPGVTGFGAGGCIADHGGLKGLFGWMGAAGTIGFIVPSQRIRVTGLINNLSVFDFAIGLPGATHADLATA